MDYYVSIDNEESNANADALSITGRVNGVNVATVIRASSVTGTPAARKAAKQKALIDAYEARASGTASSPGEKVTL